MNREPGLENVSRETLAKFVELEALVRKWNRKINLVSEGTLEDFQRRHVTDSFQLAQLGAGPARWVDLGSGAGFPGLVVAILNGGHQEIILVESDVRKCAFLRTARRELRLSCQIVNERIELLSPLNAGVISARALAPLSSLCHFAERHMAAGAMLLFPKGANWREEDMVARKTWRYDLSVAQSATQATSVILQLKNLRRMQG